MQRVLSIKPLIHNKGNHEVEELTLDNWNTFKGVNARFPSPQVHCRQCPKCGLCEVAGAGLCMQLCIPVATSCCQKRAASLH